MQTKEETLRKELERVNRNIYGLECGDDFLFTNVNGNLSLYESLLTQRKILSEKLNKGETR